MNASLQTLFTAIAAVAASAVLALTLAEETSLPAHKVVKLERVVIQGQRARVEQLPRVVVEGRRIDGVAMAQSDKPALVE